MGADLSDKDVKKRGKVELNERWWKAAWPPPGKSKHTKDMIDAIKAFKEAQRGTAQSDMLKSLDDLDKIIAKVRTDANAQFKSLPKSKKAVLNELDELEKLIEAERKAARKFGSKTREVFRYNFANRVTEALKSDPMGKSAKIKGTDVKIELLEVIVQELDEKNALNDLYAQYSRALDDEVALARDRILKIVKARHGSNPDYTKKMVQDVIDDHARNVAEIHHKVPTNVIRRLGLNAAMESEYQKALKKRRVQIAKSSVLTAASGAAIALPGTQAFAIYGFARSTAGLAQQIVEHNMSIKTAAKLLQGHLIYLAKAFDKASKGVGRAVSETGGTTLNAALGIDLVPTLDKATSSLKDLKTNTHHAGFKAQKLIDCLMDQMDSTGKLDKTVGNLPDTHPHKKKLKKSLAKQEKHLDEMIKKVRKLNKMAYEIEAKLPRLEKALKDLGKNSKKQDFANYTAKVLVNLGAIAGGGGVDAANAIETAGQSVTLAEKISAGAIAGVGFADECKSTYKDAQDLAKT